MTDIHRRALLLAATSSGVRLSAPFAAASRASGADFSEPALNLRALLKMLGSMDPAEVTVSFGTGRVYACVTGEQPVPLFSTHSVSAARSGSRPDGSFTLRQHIVGFRTAFGSESIIDRMANPLTGDAIELPMTDYGISDVEHSPAGTYLLRGTEPMKLERPRVRPWSIESGTLAIGDDAVQAGAGPAQPKIDVVTRFAPIGEVLDDSIDSALSWFSFTAADPFRPWLKMPRPG